MKKVLSIQDISCVGKCSLTVALPIISSMGVECQILPTSLLSNHTAFSHFSFLDLTDEIKNICNEDNIIIVRPKTVFDKNDTLRFEKEFCKQIYYEGYEIGKNLNISM